MTAPELTRQDISSERLAEMLDVSLGVLRQWRIRRVGPQPSWRVGNIVRYDPDVVDKWRASGGRQAWIPGETSTPMPQSVSA